jgi:Polyketide cyclase / dehydrase and lipid transport
MEESSTSATDSCELVPVRIERTSPNSRRIFGEITIPARLPEVWNILTDYNRLSIHVPNLVDSRVERSLSSGRPGDGQYQCRLYQKGAQKIIGFEFGASVTMDMKESIVTTSPTAAPISFDPSPWTSATSDMTVRLERKITFTCVDSFFFREFDGEWNVKEMDVGDGDVETLLSYVVDVRPKGPVPVAALEWRIREDVPTNLRAVKKAALQLAALSPRTSTMALPLPLAATTATATTQGKAPSSASRLSLARDARGKVQWYKDETMETYLSNDTNI